MTALRPPRNAPIVALALVVFLSGLCTASPSHSEMVFRRGEAGDPSTFDPQKTSTVIEADALYDLFEGLLTYSGEGKLIRGAAESRTVSSEGLTYVFRLTAARWSNSDSVTADDFVFTFRRLLDPATGAEYVSVYYPIRYAERSPEARLRQARSARGRSTIGRSRSRLSVRRRISSPWSPIRRPPRSIRATSPNSEKPSLGPAIS